MRHFMLAKIAPLQKRFPIGTRRSMVKNLIIAPFLIDADIDELRCRATLWLIRIFAETDVPYALSLDASLLIQEAPAGEAAQNWLGHRLVF
jgi:hypothetical protein